MTCIAVSEGGAGDDGRLNVTLIGQPSEASSLGLGRRRKQGEAGEAGRGDQFGVVRCGGDATGLWLRELQDGVTDGPMNLFLGLPARAGASEVPVVACRYAYCTVRYVG